jgi:hypothetical protein
MTVCDSNFSALAGGHAMGIIKFFTILVSQGVSVLYALLVKSQFIVFY